MSFLDLYQKDQAVARQPQPGERGDLPPTFDDSFATSWSEGRLFSQSIAGDNARQEALQDYIDEVKQRTGNDVGAGIDWTSEVPGVGPLPGPSATTMLPEVNEAVTKLNRPDVTPLSADDLETRAVAKSRAAQTAYARLQDYFSDYDRDLKINSVGGQVGLFGAQNWQNFWPRVGAFLGSSAAAATDPINIAALPIAPETEGLGILAAALRWGAVGAGAQAGIEAAAGPFHEEVEPGYGESGAPAANIGEAFAGGATLGGVTKALGNAWSRVKTGAWPTSVRDAGNVVESEANVAGSNVYPDTAGEVAHREALGKAIDDVIAERPTDVSASVTPEIEAARAARMRYIMGSRENAIAAQGEAQAERAQVDASAAPGLPFEQTAKEGELSGHIGDMASGVQSIANESGYAMDRNEAEAISHDLMKMSPDEAQDTLRDLQMSPRQVADAPTRMPAEPETPEPISVAAPDKVANSTDFEAATRADIDRERMTGDRQIPVDVDKDGNPVYRSLDGATDEIDAYHKAADEIQACSAPASEAAVTRY